MGRLLIRADDLGYSKAINYGIYEAVHNGIINNVGLMVNMPMTQQGLDLLKAENIDLGLHTVISSGKPLMNADQVKSITTDTGTFKASKDYRTAAVDFVDLDEVIVEIEAQYQKFVQLTGRRPDYFEGHAVMSDNFVKGLQIVARRHNVPFLNFAFGDVAVKFKNTLLRALMESTQPDYDPYMTFKKGIARSDNNDELPMMICHPGYLDNYILQHSSLTIPRTKEVAMLCDPAIKKLIKDESIQLVRYSELK
ncbi:ChbG/HpnK family deacetylase (plasmid) [Lactiplantibacillus plantarum]|uniref:ChbG/HpnK family deacetylase n=1 Tax=Lactiplantibacillus plantarum TaxID=1590 RepID=A0AAX1KDY2_LACPN|nr:ChbG/HpnK family deacetylase [Lactiplantibacillus plantarum]QQM62625.1 ChbG/HpnK family deacetylase [Lactiplantibacillus plantarum]